MDNRDIISIVFSHLLCWINRVLIQSNKCLIHANYPLFPLTFLQHFITCYLASIHLDILIYIYIYIYVVFMCWCHCISVVRATWKFLIYQRIFFPMSRILHIAPISASFVTYLFVREALNFDDVGAFAEGLW